VLSARRRVVISEKGHMVDSPSAPAPRPAQTRLSRDRGDGRLIPSDVGAPHDDRVEGNDQRGPLPGFTRTDGGRLP
jgi:hypothetical protein